jgi:heptosyltransferase-2
MGAKLPVRLGRYVPMPLVEYYADLAEAVGCERPGDRLELFTTPDCDESIQNRLSALGIADRHPLIVISPGAKFGASKCWLPERFAAVGDRLMESADAALIVTCGPGEEPIARQIGGAMKRIGFVFDDPLLTLGELKSLIRRSDLLICNDAGPRHFAKAFDVPVVTVFGPTHPDWTSTSYDKERIVRIDVDCGPCQQRVCPLGHHQCMTGVTVDMVFSVATSLLQSRIPQHAEPR